MHGYLKSNYLKLNKIKHSIPQSYCHGSNAQQPYVAAGYHIGHCRSLGNSVLEHFYLLSMRYCFYPLFIKSDNSMTLWKKKVSIILSITAVGDEAKIYFLWILLILLVKEYSINKFVRLHIPVHLTHQMPAWAWLLFRFRKSKTVSMQLLVPTRSWAEFHLPKNFIVWRFPKLYILQGRIWKWKMAF